MNSEQLQQLKAMEYDEVHADCIKAFRAKDSEIEKLQQQLTALRAEVEAVRDELCESANAYLDGESERGNAAEAFQVYADDLTRALDAAPPAADAPDVCQCPEGMTDPHCPVHGRENYEPELVCPDCTDAEDPVPDQQNGDATG